MSESGDFDQAGTLRRLMRNRTALKPVSKQLYGSPVRVISVTSGKGGVGKTSVVANLAVTLQKSGHKVLLLDGDFGLANLNIVLGLETKHTIYDVVSGQKEIADIIVTGPQGVQLIPASSGIFKMTQLPMSEKAILMDKLESAPIPFDVLLIDTGAGISSDVAYLNAAASEVIVIATPEPTSIADAYAMMKVMSQDHGVKRFKLLVNRVTSEREALGIYNNLLTVSDRFLNIHIEYLGFVLEDPRVFQAILSRKVLCEGWSDSPAAKCFETLADNLITTPTKAGITGNVQFFWKALLSEACI